MASKQHSASAVGAAKNRPLDPSQGLREYLLRTLLSFQRFAWDVGGVIILSISLMTLLAMVGLTEGKLISPWIDLLRRWMGYGSILVVLVTGFIGILMLRRHSANFSHRNLAISWRRVLALEAAAFAGITLLTLVYDASLVRAEAGLDGGVIGWGLAELMRLAIGDVWRWVLLIGIFGIGLVIGFGQFGRLGVWIRKSLEGKQHSKGGTVEEDDAVSVAPARDQQPSSSPFIKSPESRKKTRLPAEFQKKFRLLSDEKSTQLAPPREPNLPPLSLLMAGKPARPSERNINLMAGLIEKTLAEFGIPAQVTGFQVGPTVTQFAVEPGYVEKSGSEGEMNRQKVRVSQISSLSRDLALALSADRLRVEAPVPGRSYIGIEVPNSNAVTVRLRPILESQTFYEMNSPLALGLGLDVSGEPVVANLANMPHLLIAGTTGSGKSVCIGSLINCLVMNNAPEDLRLVVIDPKKVELVRFNGLPHLWGKVETDMDRILGVLRWVVAEMDRRYRLLEKYRSRNINTFNKKMRRRRKPPEKPLPFIVVLIDELADLMMSAAEQTESALVRLAQLARATGIHLVVATQRPSTDVVTGLIKANFPARLAFAVASSIDSRVILDTQGAEDLMGRGDMLFFSPDASGPIRAQGAMVSDKELERVVQFWQEQYTKEDAAQDKTSPWEEFLAQEAMLAVRDQLVERAIEIIRGTGRANVSMLQRRLRIGYPRAARVIDELEEMGVVGPPQGGGREREVLIDPE